MQIQDLIFTFFDVERWSVSHSWILKEPCDECLNLRLYRVLLVCCFISLFVCQHDFAKTTEQISIKLVGRMEPRKNQSNPRKMWEGASQHCSYQGLSYSHTYYYVLQWIHQVNFVTCSFQQQGTGSFPSMHLVTPVSHSQHLPSFTHFIIHAAHSSLIRSPNKFHPKHKSTSAWNVKPNRDSHEELTTHQNTTGVKLCQATDGLFSVT